MIYARKICIKNIDLNQISRNLQDSSLEMNASERARDFAIFDCRKSVSEKWRKSPPFRVGDSHFSGFSLISRSLLVPLIRSHSRALPVSARSAFFLYLMIRSFSAASAAKVVSFSTLLTHAGCSF